MPEIHIPMISVLLSRALQACIELHISALLATPPRSAMPEIHIHMISIPLGCALQACTALHNIHSTSLCP
jgi:hypothetical protein